jgi:hypothetical protein
MSESRGGAADRRPVAVSLSYRLGGPDGVSVEAAKWQWALERLGYQVRTVAGAGPVDVLVPGLDAGGWLTGPGGGGPGGAGEGGGGAVVAGGSTGTPWPKRWPAPTSSWWRTCARYR